MEMNHTKKHSTVTFRYFDLNRSLNDIFASERTTTSTGGSSLCRAMASCSNFAQMASASS